MQFFNGPYDGVQAGGLPPLLELMASRNGNLQHNAAFALYGLAENEDNIAAIVRDGGVQCLQDCELLVQVRWGHDAMDTSCVPCERGLAVCTHSMMTVFGGRLPCVDTHLSWNPCLHEIFNKRRPFACLCLPMGSAPFLCHMRTSPVFRVLARDSARGLPVFTAGK